MHGGKLVRGDVARALRERERVTDGSLSVRASARKCVA